MVSFETTWAIYPDRYCQRRKEEEEEKRGKRKRKRGRGRGREERIGRA